MARGIESDITTSVVTEDSFLWIVLDLSIYFHPQVVIYYIKRLVEKVTIEKLLMELVVLFTLHIDVCVKESWKLILLTIQEIKWNFIFAINKK